MKRFFIVVPMLLFVAGVASSQSLAEIADKEKARRKDNAEQGNKTVLEAAGVGSFGSVWWRPEDGTPATDDAPQSADATTAPSVSVSPGSDATSVAPQPSGITYKRGELPLRKTSGRRRR